MNPFELEQVTDTIKSFMQDMDISQKDWDLIMTDVEQGKIKIEFPSYTNIVLSVRQTLSLMNILLSAETVAFKDTTVIIPFSGEFKQSVLSAVEYAELKLKGQKIETNDG